MQKHLPNILYTFAAVFIGIYFFMDLLPGVTLSTLSRLVLLLLGCAFLWGWGVTTTKQKGNNKAMKICLWVFLVLFLTLFATLTLFDPVWGRNVGFIFWNKDLFRYYVENYLNLIPFKTIMCFFTTETTASPFVNLVGNTVCLMPLGVLLPLISKKQEDPWVFLGTVSAVVITVELLQFITFAGYCDIDDYILNVGGAFLMYEFTKIPKVKSFLRYVFLMEKGETE